MIGQVRQYLAGFVMFENIFHLRSLTKICLKIQVSQGLYYSRSQVLRSAELIQRLREKKGIEI